MVNFIYDSNIAHFKECLAGEDDPEKARVLKKLLAEEKAKLADWRAQKTNRSTRQSKAASVSANAFFRVALQLVAVAGRTILGRNLGCGRRISASPGGSPRPSSGVRAFRPLGRVSARRIPYSTPSLELRATRDGFESKAWSWFLGLMATRR